MCVGFINNYVYIGDDITIYVVCLTSLFPKSLNSVFID